MSLSPVALHLLMEYKEHLQFERHVSAATVQVYLSEVKRYLEFLARNVLDVETASAGDISHYFIERGQRGLVARTQARNMSALRSFHHFLMLNTIREDNPMEHIDVPKIPQTLPRIIDYNSVEEILSEIEQDEDSLYAARDRVIFEVIYSCGLRVSELAALRVEDYSAENKLLRVLGKGGKQRLIPVGEVASELLENYLEYVRPSFLSTRKKVRSIFLNRYGAPLSRVMIWKLFKKYCSRVGVDAKVHTLRHSYATHLLRGGADLRSVQELLGHSDIRTTQIYTHVDTTALQEQFNRFHPDAAEPDLNGKKKH